MSEVETYGARTIGADCMDVIGAASILLEVYAQIFRIVASFLDQDLHHKRLKFRTSRKMA